MASITQSLTYVANNVSKLPTLINFLSQPFNPPVLIFVSSPNRVRFIEQRLRMHRIPATSSLRPDMSDEDRRNALEQIARGLSWALISTEDSLKDPSAYLKSTLKGVQTVINVDFPTSATSYSERIGRVAVTFTRVAQ